jgi:AcrR family transcriptional regulator
MHRDNQREHILEVAERLLISKGIDRVSLTDIARAARLTRNTLYEYFPNKQEVVWAIFQKMVEYRQAGFADSLLQSKGTGFQRIEHFMMLMVSLLEENPDHLRFVIEFNTLYAREGNPTRVRQMWAEGYEVLAQFFQQGIEDGSIRPDLDPDLLSSAMLNLLNACNSRFALLGDLISDEYGQPVMELYREICRAFLRGIQSTPTSQESTA